jgi:hypothetical protein
MRFALKLTRSVQRAQDLMGRADLRLVRSGWDPAKVDLVRCLCRLVWSEWTHAASETAAAQKAEEAFLREIEATGNWKPARTTVPEDSESVDERPEPEWAVHSHEHNAAEHETERLVQARAHVKLRRLRAMFEKAGDEVNLLWLDRQLARDPDSALEVPQMMATATGRPVEDFYAAAKRRSRAVMRLLSQDRGVDLPEEEPSWSHASA